MSTCLKCGRERVQLEQFCAQCSTPHFRSLRYVLAIEAGLFVAAATIRGLPWAEALRPYVIPLGLLHAFTAYLFWLACDQRSFILPALVGTGVAILPVVAAFPLSAVDSVMVILAAVGFLGVLTTRRSDGGRWLATRMTWLTVAFAGLAVGGAANLSVQSPDFSRRLRELASPLADYVREWLDTRWLPEIQDLHPSIPFYAYAVGLGGLATAMLLGAAREVAQRGLRVAPDYLPNARIAPPRDDLLPQTSALLKPVVILGLALIRAAIVFYNALVRVINSIIRAIVYTLRLAYAVVRALGLEVLLTLRLAGSYARSVARKIALPLAGIYLVTAAVAQSEATVSRHLQVGSALSGARVCLGVGMVVAGCVMVLIANARGPLRSAAELAMRECASALPYAILAFAIATCATIGIDRILSASLQQATRYTVGPLTGSALALLILGFLVVCGQQMIARRQRMRTQALDIRAEHDH